MGCVRLRREGRLRSGLVRQRRSMNVGVTCREGDMHEDAEAQAAYRTTLTDRAYLDYTFSLRSNHRTTHDVPGQDAMFASNKNVAPEG